MNNGERVGREKLTPATEGAPRSFFISKSGSNTQRSPRLIYFKPRSRVPILRIPMQV